MSFRRIKHLALAAAALLSLTTLPALAAERPGNSARFTGGLKGFPGVIAVDTAPGEGPQARSVARQRALEATAIPVSARERSARIFRRMGALGSRTPLRHSRIVAWTSGGRRTADSARSTALAVTAKSTAAATAQSTVSTRGLPLSFKYSGAFTAQQISDFSAWRDTAYPLMVQTYGEPAPTQQGKQVTIIYDATAGDGIYELPPTGSATSGGTIYYDPVLAGTGLSAAEALAINNYNLTRMMLIAFHGGQIMAFDAWERGFADAAALAVMYTANPSATFDPSSLGVYLLPVYDILNRPELGNPYFFAQNTSPNLGYYRLGMAQAAWLKVWVENQNFFAAFNSAYYAQYSEALAGNTPALKGIANGIAPQVEGLGFNDWYRRQHVLNTAITTGEKLWLAVIPQANLESGDTRSVFFGVAQHYSTAANGEETPLSGQGTIAAYNENNIDITSTSAELRADTRVLFNQLGEAELNSQNVGSGWLPVIGFLGTGSPDTGRITIVITVGSAQASALFPFNVAGTISAPSGYYGATIGANGGSAFSIASNGSAKTPPSWQRGAFKSTSAYPTGPQVKTTFTFTPQGEGARTVQRNSAWAYYGGLSQSLAAIIEARSAGSAVPVNIGLAASNKLRMISLPLYPVQSDEAAALGVPPASLSLARYFTTATPSGISAGGISFGITGDRHELYPHISEPFQPGRGYWITLDTPLSTTVQGSGPSTSQPFEIPLRAGWTQIGVPFNITFSMSAVQVSYNNGTAVPFATAVQNGWIASGVWRWKPEGGYQRVDSGAAPAQQLAPFEGFHIYTPIDRGVKLIFNPQASQSAALTQAANTAKNWQLALTLTEESATDSGSFGVSEVSGGKPLRAPAAKPPAGPRVPTLSFLTSGNAALDATKAGDAEGWADSFIAPLAANATGSWRFLADGTSSGRTVTLSWGNPAALPTALDITLIDESTGQTTVISEGGVAGAASYSYVSSGSARTFRIEANTGSLRVKVTSPADGAVLR